MGAGLTAGGPIPIPERSTGLVEARGGRCGVCGPRRVRRGTTAKLTETRVGRAARQISRTTAAASKAILGPCTCFLSHADMAVRPSRLRIRGLFGHLSHDIALRGEDRITILSGPNGSGKTQSLNLLRGAVALDFAAVARLPFEAADISYTSGARLAIERQASDDGVSLAVEGYDSREHSCGRTVVRAERRFEDALPPYLRALDDNLWQDDRDGELMTTDEVFERYPRARGLLPNQLAYIDQPDEQAPEWLQAFAPTAAPTLIATRRLDLAAQDVRRRRRYRVDTPRPEAAARIYQYVEAIKEQVADARRASLEISQRADRGFASRALDKARATVNERQLRATYEGLATLHHDLHENGLTAESMGVAFPAGKTNPTERRILNVFLDDWLAKLQPLEPVHQKLQIFRDIVGAKMKDKHLEIAAGDLRFTTASGEAISVEMLSSGEQHLLALFSMLLFYAARGTLVLIDEPEISLHAAWKHAFLSDIRRIAAVNDLQLVLATHSTAIINGEWDLVEEMFLTS